MQECLTDYIGISPITCGVSTPSKSGLYVTDLEGISLNMASKIVTEDRNGAALLQRKINFATGLVLNDLTKYLTPYFQMNRVLDVVKSGIFTGKYLEPVSLERGLVITFDPTATGTLGLRILTVQILTQSTVIGALLKITDGTTTYQYPVNLTPGNIVTFTIPNGGFTTFASSVYITLDNVNISVDEGSFATSTSGGCRCQSKTSNAITLNNVQVYGWNGISAESNRSFGMTVTFQLECSFDRYICALIPNMSYLFLYRSGIEIIKEQLTTERINEMITPMKRDMAGYILEKWEKQYDCDYKAFVQSIRQLVSSMKDGCVDCRGTRYGYQI